MTVRQRLVWTLFLAAAASGTHGWTSPTRHNRALTVTVLHGSRAATKWERKKVWLEQRGGGMPVATVSSSSSPADVVGAGWAAEIIGAGRIGEFLATAGHCVSLGRDDNIDPAKEGQPILIATRNDALAGIVEKCPENRRKDLVFLQNGYLDNFLKEKGLLDNTQVLLYLSVTAKGAQAVDGVTTVNPEVLHDKIQSLAVVYCFA